MRQCNYKELRLISGRPERAARIVDDVERLLGVKTRWQRRDIAVDERDHMGRTPQHWAVYQRDKVSTQILLKMARWVLTRTQWVVMASPYCTGQLSLGTRGASGFSWKRAWTPRRKTKRIAHSRGNGDQVPQQNVWESVIEELGFMHNGTRVRRPLSEVRGRSVVLLARHWQKISLKLICSSRA